MPAPVTTWRWVSISQHLCTLYISSSLAMASSILHNLIQNNCRIMKLVFCFVSNFICNKPNHYSEVLQLYSSLNYSDYIIVAGLWLLCCTFLWPFIFYMLDNIVTMSYANMRINKNLSNNVCCLNLYAWNSEVYIWE